MESPRPSIAGLMAVVVVVAFNAAAARALVSGDAELLIGVAPVAVALEFGAFRAARGRGRARAFWLGFVAAGAATAASLAWALAHENSLFHSIWASYLRSAEDFVHYWFSRLGLGAAEGDGLLLTAVSLVIRLAPQLAASAVAGLAVASVAGRPRRAPADDARTSPLQEARP